MKKVALVISLFAFIFAFTVSTASAQKVTSAQKAKTEKVCSGTEVPAKTCCASSTVKTATCSKAEEAKTAGCSKTCSKAEGKSCCNKGVVKTDATPVPKEN